MCKEGIYLSKNFGVGLYIVSELFEFIQSAEPLQLFIQPR